jgi:hypothetical protein
MRAFVPVWSGDVGLIVATSNSGGGGGGSTFGRIRRRLAFHAVDHQRGRRHVLQLELQAKLLFQRVEDADTVGTRLRQQRTCGPAQLEVPGALQAGEVDDRIRKIRACGSR